MAKNAINKTLIALSAILMILVSVLAGAMLFPVTKTVTSEKVVLVDKPMACNMSADSTQAKLDILLAEDNFEAVALEKAKAKVNTDDLFDFLVGEGKAIDYSEDITSVEVKDSDVSNVDAKDKDAKVVLTLIVKYEDSDGADKKVTLEGTFNVIDGKLKDSGVDYAFA